MRQSGTSPNLAQPRPTSPGEVGRRSPGKCTSPVGGASRGRPCHGGQARGPGQGEPGDLSARQLTLFSGPPVDARYDHVWAWGRPAKALPPYDPQLKGRRCRVVYRAKPRHRRLLPGNPLIEEHVLDWFYPATKYRDQAKGSAPLNVAVEFPDGEIVCAPRWAVRRAR